LDRVARGVGVASHDVRVAVGGGLTHSDRVSAGAGRGTVRIFGVGLVVGLVALLLGLVPAAASPPGASLIFDGPGAYPRVVRLAHSGGFNGRLIASVNSNVDGDGVGLFFESRDGGRTFQQVGAIAEPDGARGRGQCCGALFELPRRLGVMPPGTLLWADTTGWEVPPGERHVKQRLWRSIDHGRNWTFLADVALSPNQYNAWEPEISMASDGHLVMFWADESDKPLHDQKIVQVRSLDGVRWTDQRDTVTYRDFFVRPGMPVVRQLLDGTYFMAYEVCNLPEPLCAIYYRTSLDGWDYGDPFSLGTGVRTADGKYPRHTPSIDVAASGVVLLVSEMLVNADGSHASDNGAAILVNDHGGQGPWREISAPVATPGVNNEGCRNFSPALLASADGHSVLEISTDLDAGVCKAYYATGAVT